MNVKINPMLVLPLFAACALSACNRPAAENAQDKVAAASASATEDLQKAQEKQAKQTAEAARDLQESQERAKEKVADKQAAVADTAEDVNKDVAKARADYQRDTADADYEVAKTKAEGDLKVALERCDAQAAGAARDACRTRAKTFYDRSVAEAKAAFNRAKQTAATTDKRAH